MTVRKEPSPEEMAQVVAEMCDSFWSFATIIMFWDFLSKYRTPAAQLDSLIDLWGKNYERQMRAFADQSGGEIDEERLKRMCGLAKDEIREKAASGMSWIKSHKSRTDED